MSIAKKKYKCDSCEKMFRQKTLFNIHKWKKHDQGSASHICHFCAKAFVTIKHYNLHFKNVHRNGDNFDCGLCDQKFIRKLLLKKHMKTTHKNEFENDENHQKGKENITSQESNDNDRNTKEIVDKSLSIQDSHKVMEEEIPPNEAKVKPVVINFSKDIIIDEESSQNTNKNEAILLKEEYREVDFKCNICDKRFETILKLENHIEDKHFCERTFLANCNICKEQYVVQNDNDNHICLINID